MNYKNEEKYIYLRGLNDMDKYYLDKSLGLLDKALKNYKEVDGDYIYECELVEHEEAFESLKKTIWRCFAYITDNRDTINIQYHFINQNGKIEYPKNIFSQSFSLISMIDFSKKEEKIDEYNEKYYIYNANIYLNPHTIEYLDDIKCLLKYKKEKDLDLYKIISK
jgi:hypothetical protein